MDDVAALNRRFESSGALPAEAWSEWLWRSDPEEACDPMVLLNRNQLLGILVCRYKARNVHPHAALADCGRMSLGAKKTHTWRGLKDSVTNVQLEWPEFLKRLADNPRPGESLKAVQGLVEECASRFGAFLGRAHPPAVLDDVADTEPAQGGDMRSLTIGAARRMAGTLLVLYRHLHLMSACTTLPRAPREVGLNRHHAEASTDTFYTWYMHFQLPVAAKLNYKHDFPGLYNSVTQVVYFHNSRYERPARDDRTPIHVLPSLCQVHPEIPVRFEEDHVDITRKAGWYWLLVPGRVYLVTPEPRVLYSDDATTLLGYYLDHREALAPPAAPAPPRGTPAALLMGRRAQTGPAQTGPA